MGWSPTDKETDALIRTSGATSEVSDELYESGGSSYFQAAFSSDAVTTGKWYAEFQQYLDPGGSSLVAQMGVCNASWDATSNNYPGNAPTNSIAVSAKTAYSYAVEKVYNGFRTNLGIGTWSSASDIFRVAFDTATGKVWFGFNNTWSGDPAAGTGEAGTLSGSAFRLVAGSLVGNENVIRLRSWVGTNAYSLPSGFSMFPAPAVPGVGSLTLGGQVPTVEVWPYQVAPGRDQLALTGQQPSADVGIYGMVSKAAVIITGGAPTIENRMTIASGTPDALSITGLAPAAWQVISFGADVDLPGVTGEATGLFGNYFAGNAELPPLEGDSKFGYQGDADLLPLTASGTLQIGRLFTGNGRLPAIRGEATADLGHPFSADIDLPSIQGEGTMLVGRGFSADITLPAITGEGTLYRTLVFSADIDLPPVEMDGSILLTGGLFTGFADFPPITGEGTFSDATVLTYYALSTNTFNRAHGYYIDTDFNGIGRLGTDTYVAMSDGLYLLDGDDDDGVTIEAYFMLGYEDFGVEAVKAQRVAYLGYSSDGPGELLVRTDVEGKTNLYSYTVEAPHTNAEDDAPARVKLGRGLRGRYWQMGYRNADGADFRFDRLGLGVWNSTRKR